MRAIVEILRELIRDKTIKTWAVIGLIIYLWGVLTYVLGCGAGVAKSVYYSVKLFAFDVHPELGGDASACPVAIYIVGFVALVYASWGIISIAFKKLRDARTFISITSAPHTLVFGLGDKAAAYIDSALKEGNDAIVAIERDPANPRIETYRARGIGVKIADAKDPALLKSLPLNRTERMIALTGSDTENFEIALALKSRLAEEEGALQDLYLRIDDPSLEKLYAQGGIFDDSSHLMLHFFSMARNSARELWLRHSIDGDGREYIDSDKPFEIVVAGGTGLGIEVIGQIAELAHLPNENHVTIHCIDTDAKRFEKRVRLRYPRIDALPHLSLAFHARDSESRAYYTESVWDGALTHVVLTYEDSQTNLDIATELVESTYLETAKSQKPHIHVAIYENTQMAKAIEENKDKYARVHPFANTAEMASHQWIVNETFLAIAKRIHAGYREQYRPLTTYGDTQSIEAKWFAIKHLNDRPSNLAQAYHIPLKLKALGLSYRPSDKNPDNDLIAHNRRILNEAIGKELAELGLDDASLIEKTKTYYIKKKKKRGEEEVEVETEDWNAIKTFDFFPTDFTHRIAKLMRSEHNRWNAYHYLRGWHHTTGKTDKPTKHHRCLTPMPQMDPQDHHTALYDLLSILYTPNLMADRGFELVDVE